MATNTTNYNLVKPTLNETADIEVINSNMDIIDTNLKKIEEATTNINVPVKSVNSKTGEVILNKDDVGLGNVNNWPTSSEVNNPSDTVYATAGAVKKAYDKALEAFQSASNGKTKIAAAITGKGVATSSTDTFEVMAAKINSIKLGATIETGEYSISSQTTSVYISGFSKKPKAFFAYVTGYNSSSGYFPTDQIAGVLLDESNTSYKVVGFGWNNNSNIGANGSMRWSYGQMYISMGSSNYLSSGSKLTWIAVY